jgi:hypothetical protein
MLENTEGAIKKGKSIETGNIDEEKQNKNTTQHNMCWTPLYANKHKSHGTQNVKTHNRTTQKTKKMSITDPTKNSGSREG